MLDVVKGKFCGDEEGRDCSCFYTSFVFIRVCLGFREKDDYTGEIKINMLKRRERTVLLDEKVYLFLGALFLAILSGISHSHPFHVSSFLSFYMSTAYTLYPIFPSCKSSISPTLTVPADTSTGTLREYSVSNPPPGPESQYPFPHDLSDRRNWPALPAVETVRRYVAKYESLDWIAWRADVEDGVLEAHDYRVSAASSFSSLGEPLEARRKNGLGECGRE